VIRGLALALAFLAAPFCSSWPAPSEPSRPGRSVFDPRPLPPSSGRICETEQIYLDWKVWRAQAEAHGLEIKRTKIHGVCVTFYVGDDLYAFPRKLPEF